MTVTALNITAAAESLKRFYLPGLRNQLNYEPCIFLAQVESGSQGVTGEEIAMALRYGYSGGISSVADNAKLPTPSPRKSIQAKWKTKNLFGRMRITEKAIQASKDNVGAFTELLRQTVEDLEEDSKLNLSRQSIGNGTGKLCAVTSSTSNIVTIDSNLYLMEGMLVDIYNHATTGAKVGSGSGVEILQILTDTTIKISATVGTSGAAMYIKNSKGNELTGLDAVIDATTGASLYGIEKDDYRWLHSNVTDLAGEISEVKIQKEIHRVNRLSGSKTNFLLVSQGVQRAYQNLQLSMKQHVNTMDLKGGFTALTYNGMPLAEDRYVKSGCMYGLDLNDWKMYQMADWDWLNRHGSMFSQTADYAAWEASLFKFCDIGCQRPRGQFLLYGITEH